MNSTGDDINPASNDPGGRITARASGGAHVPVSMCSRQSRTVDAGGFLVSDVWFPPGTVIPRHTHDRAVLGVMLDGGFDNRFATRTLDPVEGDLFTEPGEEPHANRVGSGGARVLAVQPDPSDEHLARAGRTLLDEVRSLRHPGVALTARRLAIELQKPDDMSEFAIESLALDMIVTGIRFDASRSEPVWLARVDQIIHDTYRQGPRVGDIAHEVGVHRAELARVYKRHRGLPLSTHVRELRLAWAAERLIESSDGLSSIAFEAGFADQSHLTREFKRCFGLPPGAYRRALGV
ncbi:MAG: AraC family transcriptional regulator [Gemmatimonadota bacterium]|nr:AraC family transcriptional regulator [Gemmatimonadota bacterium]